jgi:thioredoxin reductase (NADPH)
MYGARLGMKTLCLGTSHGSELPLGGVITTTNLVENYPGFIKISGEELANKIKQHAESYDLAEIREEEVLEASKEGNSFLIKTSSDSYQTRAILFATGTKWRKLDVPGSKEFENKGVAYCALCDGPLFKNKVVAVIGGSDSAIKDALVLAEHAQKVYIIYRRDKIRAEPINMKRIEHNQKIEVITNTNVTEIQGNKSVQKVILDREIKGSKELPLNGVFVAIGHISLSELATKLDVKVNDKKEIIIDTPTKQIYHYKKFNTKKFDIYYLSYSDAFDKNGNKVWICLYLYNNKPCFFHVIYGDGEFMYKIL